jgi:nicotinamide mononucleotide transporter
MHTRHHPTRRIIIDDLAEEIVPDILESLNSPAFSVWDQQLSVAEVLGFVSGLWCVWLTAKKNILNFPVGIMNCALLLLLFADARLFADASLQIIFITLGVRGWWLWSRHGEVTSPPIAVASARMMKIALVASVVLSICIAVLLRFAHGSVPVFDGTITGLSLVAQWLLNRKILQTWYWWIAVDVISVPVYVYKELYLIALLYAVFLAICIVGLGSWKKELPIKSQLLDSVLRGGAA